MARKRIVSLVVAALAVGAVGVGVAQAASARHANHGRHDTFGHSAGATSTPIKHVVVIFQENVSFDHYFGTYPNAANSDGQHFDAASGTPPVAGLAPATDASLPAALRHASRQPSWTTSTATPSRRSGTTRSTTR